MTATDTEHSGPPPSLSRTGGAAPPRAARAPRLLLLAAGGVSMLAGLNAALLLLGLPAPLEHTSGPGLHGMLMVLGFLGTLISLERAVALRAPWGLLAPALLGAGALMLLTPVPAVVGQLLLVNGAVMLCAVYVALWQRSRDHTVLVQFLGALLAACAALLWGRVGIADLVALLTGFIVLTIAAERVELARLTLPRRADLIILAIAGALVGAALAAVLWPGVGARLFGLMLVGLSVYLLRHDVARRMIGSHGLPRFAAAAMLVGYLWLILSGLLWVVGGPAQVPGWYDLVVHGVFLGFGMSMVMAHAPVILPAVLRIQLPYHPVLWAPLTALHTGMVVRSAGVCTDNAPLWQAGGVATIISILLLALSAAALAVRAGLTRKVVTP